MSRLDSNIRRLEAQRACLNMIAERLRHLPGPVIELGLGNGRTYDHLREVLPDREIFVFDRQIGAHPDCIPDSEHLLLGEIRDTLPGVFERMPGRRRWRTVIWARPIPWPTACSPHGWPRLCRPCCSKAPGWFPTDLFGAPRFDPNPLPSGIAPDRYFVYRHEPK